MATQLMTHSLVERAARAAHEVNRAYCAAIGDHSQPAWEDAPDWQRASACAGVVAVLDGSAATPEAQHDTWLAHKRADGWVFGPAKDADAKTHPCMVPYADLPPDQKVKDYLFRGALRAVLPAGTL